MVNTTVNNSQHPIIRYTSTITILDIIKGSDGNYIARKQTVFYKNRASIDIETAATSISMCIIIRYNAVSNTHYR